jgi:hypothetical protein
MALVLLDRVQQTATAIGTTSFTLTGNVSGFQTFAVIGNGNTTYYSATDILGNWEVGVGTYFTSGPTLIRTTILSSSNSGSAVTFISKVNVFVTYPSEKSVNQDESNNVTLPASLTLGNALSISNGGTGAANAPTALTNLGAYPASNPAGYGVGTVTSVTGTSPVSVATGTTTPVISMAAATSSVNGYLTNTDWSTFNGKAPAVTYTTGYIPYGQGTTTPNQSANLQFDGNNLSVTGTGKFGSSVMPNAVPSTTWGIDFTPSTSAGSYVSIANNGVYALSGGSGIVYVWENGGNGVSATNCYYGTAGTFFNPQALYSNTAGLATKVNIYYNGAGAYVIQNLSGGTLNFFISTIRLRTSI